MTKCNTAIFCTADEKYIPYAVIALRSMGKFFDFPLFILTDVQKIDKKLRKFLDKYNISTLHSRCFDLFSVKKHFWSPIAYGKFEAPELLFKEGFSHSISIDADILCRKSFDAETILNNTHNFSGIANQTPIEENINNFEKFRRILKKDFDMPLGDYGTSILVNPNSGFLFWNNKWAYNFCLFSKSQALNKKFGMYLRAIDQSLLAVIILINTITYNVIDHVYNFRTGNAADRALPIADDDIINIHYTGNKPWRGLTAEQLLTDEMEANWIFEWYILSRRLLT
ncbi:MAG: hypothetical protein LBB60_07940 [Desulfovibrio sp.]|jgi:lipopolysaccharide biosynthesis glycosyltransferase|nr:hypothetical protein [Desulfovibrio sp.]